MSVKSDFIKLGYEQKVYSDPIPCIQYTKNENITEKMIFVKTIEFYPAIREVVVYRSTYYVDGTVVNGGNFTLNVDELTAVYKQSKELKW
ncbi:hypothetical protein D3C71_1294050 [compost metagenome]